MAGRAFAATTAAQMVELSRAGLDDEVLIALIETDGSSFHLTADDILSLHQQGLSDRVIRAMQETARMPAPTEAPVPPEPTRVEAIPPVVQQVPIVNLSEPPPPVAVYPLAVVYVPIEVPSRIRPAEHRAPPAPEYWGFGGQRRPDSWDDGGSRRPAAADKKTDQTSPQKSK
jgi:hypothetical protein